MFRVAVTVIRKRGVTPEVIKMEAKWKMEEWVVWGKVRSAPTRIIRNRNGGEVLKNASIIMKSEVVGVSNRDMGENRRSQTAQRDG